MTRCRQVRRPPTQISFAGSGGVSRGLLGCPASPLPLLFLLNPATRAPKYRFRYVLSVPPSPFLAPRNTPVHFPPYPPDRCTPVTPAFRSRRETSPQRVSTWDTRDLRVLPPPHADDASAGAPLVTIAVVIRLTKAMPDGKGQCRPSGGRLRRDSLFRSPSPPTMAAAALTATATAAFTPPAAGRRKAGGVLPNC